MGSSPLLRGAIRVGTTLAGFVGGFLITAGVYGLLFTDRLVTLGLRSRAEAYLLSVALLVFGVFGLTIQRYSRREISQ